MEGQEFETGKGKEASGSSGGGSSWYSQSSGVDEGDRVSRNPMSRFNGGSGSSGTHAQKETNNQYVRSKYIAPFIPGRPRSLVDLTVGSLIPRQRALRLIVILLQKKKVRETKDNHQIHTLLVADQTGSVHLTLFGHKWSLLNEGDILRVENGFTALFHNSLTLKIGTEGKVERIGDYSMNFSEEPFMSEVGKFDGGTGEVWGSGGGGSCCSSDGAEQK